MNRRDALRTGAASLAALGAASTFPFGWTAKADEPKKRHKLLVYTHSEGFQHSVVAPAKGKSKCLVEEVLTELGSKHGFDITHTKDGRIFLPETLKEFDAFFFQTQGDLMKEKSQDGQPPMTAEGKKALLDAIAAGKGFAGCHCASDTFHSPGHRNGDFVRQPTLDPYIEMLGGEFIRHGQQQKSWMRVVDPKFPGTEDVKDFQLTEEWYSLKNFAPDLHVILVQDTKGMHNEDYQRPNYPATWARMHHKGRVFFSSMGHREDVWTNPTFQQLLVGGLSWVFGDVNADVTPNIKETAPNADEMPKTKK
jgi:type 1 glutamine amidotransferase